MCPKRPREGDNSGDGFARRPPMRRDQAAARSPEWATAKGRLTIPEKQVEPKCRGWGTPSSSCRTRF